VPTWSGPTARERRWDAEGVDGPPAVDVPAQAYLFDWLLTQGPGLETERGIVIQATGEKMIVYYRKEM
jgi:hypothetical protein